MVGSLSKKIKCAGFVLALKQRSASGFWTRSHSWKMSEVRKLYKDGKMNEWKDRSEIRMKRVSPRERTQEILFIVLAEKEGRNHATGTLSCPLSLLMPACRSAKSLTPHSQTEISFRYKCYSRLVCMSVLTSSSFSSFFVFFACAFWPTYLSL